MRIVIFHAGDDDPKKCTARKLGRMGLAQLVESPLRLPDGALLLDPFAEKAVSPEDATLVDRSGLAAVDCSWKNVQSAFAKARRNTEPRALPYLVAANPVKYGHATELSTLEALAATLYIIGRKGLAAGLLDAYTWGKQFLALNHEPLEAYAACATSAEVVAVMQEFLPPQRDPA